MDAQGPADVWPVNWACLVYWNLWNTLKKCKPCIVVLLVGSIEPGMINWAQKSICIPKKLHKGLRSTHWAVRIQAHPPVSVTQLALPSCAKVNADGLMLLLLVGMVDSLYPGTVSNMSLSVRPPAIMVYRVFRNENKRSVKILHAVLHVTALIFSIIGERSVFVCVCVCVCVCRFNTVSANTEKQKYLCALFVYCTVVCMCL